MGSGGHAQKINSTQLLINEPNNIILSILCLKTERIHEPYFFILHFQLLTPLKHFPSVEGIASQPPPTTPPPHTL